MSEEANRQRFRDAMARLAAAVNVITTDGPHGRCGFTASAVCSVTDSPPTMLACVNRSSYSHAVLSGNRHVCINVLAAHDTDTANLFAGRTGCTMADRFEQRAWMSGVLGTPVLANALVALEGRIVDSKTVGSHAVFFVEIDDIAIDDGAASLVYFDRQFHRLGMPAATHGSADHAALPIHRRR
ncbi:flavin reductase [Chitinasiproducens palmae]|uniref:4-hydroxyphenylacetate 3-monooxygenase reductase component n=1 Tax=Chitinasiproducens palmae TaxID=1770053 RepID=A0A1H2PKQ4_9BURK|nr:flavin reductase [Chitinasiproducens palmae]SDV46975.1 4-hydroxyphenylacetate 3-monooxygenase reductase component [Chitinasiproducens palmae]